MNNRDGAAAQGPPASRGPGQRPAAGRAGPPADQGLVVTVTPNLPPQLALQRALRLLGKKVEHAGILREVRQRRHYIKPSDRERLKRHAARRQATVRRLKATTKRRKPRPESRS